MSEKPNADSRVRMMMLSAADTVEGQGVGSAYKELMGLLERLGQDDFIIEVNRSPKNSDAVHIHTIGLGSYLRMKFCRKPKIVSVHFTPRMIENSVRMWKPFMAIFKGYIKHFYRSADYVHVVNPNLIEELESCGIKKEKVHYIPNFVAKSRFFALNDEERETVRERYGIKKSDFVCFASGQTRAGKGVKDFVAVAKMLPEVKFFWAGGFPFGSMADGYHEIKEMLEHLPDNVKFLGVVKREEINDLLNAADLFFFPSYEELFPMSILEAASTHTPLLLRDLPEYRNILTGYFLPAQDNEEFARDILSIRDDQKLYDELTQKATAVSEEYSEEAIYQLWKKFYYDCADRR